LKAPLRAMEQLAGFVLEDAGQLLPEESHRDLEQVQQRSKRLIGLLDGLLQYSRIGRREGSPTWVDTNVMLAELVDLCVPADRFEVEITSSSLPAVYAPRPAVELVFRNLLMNAVKHSDLDHGRIQISCHSEDRCDCFTVTDDGPGIPSTQRDKVFELFQTLKGRIVNEASGMGLALVKRTIETHGGTIDLVGSDGRGTNAELRWPRQAPPPQPPTGQQGPSDSIDQPTEDRAYCTTPRS
jgi:signal transduction histidine kinase